MYSEKTNQAKLLHSIKRRIGSIILLVLTKLACKISYTCNLSGTPVGSCCPLGREVKYLLCLTLFVAMGSDVKTLMLEHWLLEVHSLWIASCQWPGLDKGQLTFLRILQAAEVAKRNKPTQIHNSFTRSHFSGDTILFVGRKHFLCKTSQSQSSRKPLFWQRKVVKHYYQARIA